MKISEYGEFQFIERLSSNIQYTSKKTIVGIGDDCSVREFDEKYYQIFTTDLLIEAVHFLKNKITPFELGKKLIEVNVSDIVSMGGFPETVYLSIAIPENVEIEYLDHLFMGINDSASNYGIELMGGDTSKSPQGFYINVLVQGLVEKDRVKLRSGSVKGDLICVSDVLGDSHVGLKILLNEWDTKSNQYFIEQHNRPKAQLEKARFLSRFPEIHSMIDISDGLASEIKHICKKSGLGARIDLDAIPTSPQFKKFFGEEKLRAFETAAESGEEYRLLFTVSKDFVSTLSTLYEKKFEEKLYVIGEMTEVEMIDFNFNHEPITNHLKGFNHFGENQ